MGRNRRRHRNRHWEDGDEVTLNGHPYHNPTHRTTPRTARGNSNQRMHSDHNSSQDETQQNQKVNRSKGSSQPYQQKYPSKTQRPPTSDRHISDAAWRLGQSHLKKYLVEALSLAVQTIELYVSEPASVDDLSETDIRGDGSDDNVDEMEWQHEKEVLVPNHAETRFTWVTNPLLPCGNSDTGQTGSPSCTSGPFRQPLLPTTAFGNMLPQMS